MSQSKELRIGAWERTALAWLAVQAHGRGQDSPEAGGLIQKALGSQPPCRQAIFRELSGYPELLIMLDDWSIAAELFFQSICGRFGINCSFVQACPQLCDSREDDGNNASYLPDLSKRLQELGQSVVLSSNEEREDACGITFGPTWAIASFDSQQPNGYSLRIGSEQHVLIPIQARRAAQLAEILARPLLVQIRPLQPPNSENCKFFLVRPGESEESILTRHAEQQTAMPDGKPVVFEVMADLGKRLRNAGEELLAWAGDPEQPAINWPWKSVPLTMSIYDPLNTTSKRAGRVDYRLPGGVQVGFTYRLSSAGTE